MLENLRRRFGEGELIAQAVVGKVIDDGKLNLGLGREEDLNQIKSKVKLYDKME